MNKELEYKLFSEKRSQERKQDRQAVKKKMAIALMGALIGAGVHGIFFDCTNSGLGAVAGFFTSFVFMEGGIVTAKKCKSDKNKNFLSTFFSSSIMAFCVGFAVGGLLCQLCEKHTDSAFFPVLTSLAVVFFLASHQVYQNNYHHQGFTPCNL